ncbi:pilus assembly protein FimV [Methylocaldum szegediense]|uniref:Pilus assembly protein FimV n=2 Tax=Methylocaldum szegediense TaxID=73780 RepID=A0ABN8WZE5_9GAMM|nr:FimV/HubP family polar landmark protein [Methylocaldum szegediense]CAI8777034.1 pilus assembly protein FimV [Methylocaldum szegediense]
MRKLSTTLAMMSLLAPMGTSALGIGDIRLRSTLNQTLSAEIPLVLSGDDSLADVKVTLASPEAFAKAGLERHYFLTKLRFNAVQKPDGSYAIEVSSNDVMREPFVSFLVEVNWPRGRVIREYTVLLDPPATFSDHALADADVPSVYEQPMDRHWQPAETNTSRGNTTLRATARTASAAPESSVSGSEYGPVKKDSTLWEIAKLVNRDPDVTHEQMVIALYRNNPQAFYGDTPDTLKAGEILKIPDREFILQVTSSEARAELARWNDSRTGKLASRSSKQQKLNADGSTTSPTQAQLKLLAPSDHKTKDEEAVVGTAGGTGKSKGEIALEIAETLKQENEELRSRLSALEQQLNEMHRLITLKDEQIALLQQSQEQQPLTEPTGKDVPSPEQLSAQSTPEQKAEPSSPTDAQTQPALTTDDTEKAVQPPPSSDITPEEPKLAPPKPTPAPQVMETSIWDELFEQPAYAVGGAAGLMLLGVIPWLLARRRAAMIEETESILIAAEKENLQKSKTLKQFDSTVSDSTATAKTSFLSEFTPSDFDALGAETDEIDPIAEADVYLAYGRYKQAEDLIRNAIEQYPDRDECKLKLLEIHYATENREAFERFAEELKAQGKDSNASFWENVVEMGRELCPGSPLFAGSSSTSPVPVFGSNPSEVLGAIDLTDELIEDLKRFDDEVTETSKSAEEKHVSLDFQIDVNSSDVPPTSLDKQSVVDLDTIELQEEPVVGTSHAKEEHSDLENLIEFDTGKLETDSQGQHYSQASGNATDDTVPDLAATATHENKTESGDVVTASNNEMLDFDFVSLDAEASKADAEVLETGNELPKLDNLIPFNADRSNFRAESQIQGETDPSIDDILRELARNDAQQDQASNQGSESVSNLETSELGFDLASSIPGDGETFDTDDIGSLVEEESDDFAPLTDMDPMETKLDLAKAYADMDDKQSALDMLMDVLEMGNEQQKAEASALMDKLNLQEAPSTPKSVITHLRRT